LLSCPHPPQEDGNLTDEEEEIDEGSAIPNNVPGQVEVDYHIDVSDGDYVYPDELKQAIRRRFLSTDPMQAAEMTSLLLQIAGCAT
jgi:hypothetical protein